MGANFLLYQLPKFEWTDARMQAIFDRISKLTAADIPEHEKPTGIDRWQDRLRACVRQLPVLTNCREVTTFCNYWVTGGMSAGDFPTESAGVFDSVAESPLYDLFETFQKEDLAAAEYRRSRFTDG